MKHLKLILLFQVFILLLASCSKVVKWQPDEDEISLYSKIYLPQAERPAISIIMNPEMTEGYTTEYNAYLGGPVTASKEIAVKFAVNPQKVEAYNTSNSTDYELLPAANYLLKTQTALILKGKRSSESIELEIIPGESLEMFKTYLLPITLSAEAAPLNEELNTAFIIIKVTYRPGEVPNQKVLSMGANWGDILTNGAGGTLYRRDNKKDILVHVPDVNGVYSEPPRLIGVFWDASESFYFVNDQHMVVRNYPYWAGLFRFKIKDNYELEAYPEWTDFWLGDFWDKYVIVPHKSFFFLIDNEGKLLRMPAMSFVETPKATAGSGFQMYKQVLSYSDYLMAVKNDGTLWIYPVSAEGKIGPVRQVGTGWNKYTKLIISGGDVLALDSNGDLYRYKFDPSGYYPL